MVKPPLRTKSIGFKVSEDEYSQLETSAQMSGRTLGEWCREVVQANASGEPSKAGPGPAETLALMAELVALRAILLGLLGLALAALGFFWGYFELPTPQARVIHTVWQNTVTVIGLVVFVLEIYLAWAYRNAFRPMLAAKVTPGGN